MLWIKIWDGIMISIGIIECLEEVHLVHHLVSIGTQINTGGIGQVILLSIWDSIIGTRLGLTTMVGEVDTMDMDMVGITIMVGMDMVQIGMVGDIDREWMIMHGEIEIEQIQLM